MLSGILLGACSEQPLTDESAPPPAEPFVPDWPVVRFTSPSIPAYGPTPSPQQFAWQSMEVNALLSIGLNTFTGEEVGNGREDPALFNPTELDASQWVRAAQEGGITGMILVAKHHDGFALWPSWSISYSVQKSPWRGGRGNLVREVADATQAAAMPMGTYLSPYDLHDPTFGTDAYTRSFLDQLYQLIGYVPNLNGPLFEFWLDGFTGRDGKPLVLDMPAVHREIRQYQPGAVIAFRDVGWGGNEEGQAPDTYWNNRSETWIPIECDASLRRLWFWRADQDPRPLGELVDMYFESVGRDCVLLLGLAPDTRGLLETEDVVRLAEWRQELDRLFATNWARYAPAIAASTRPGSDGWAASAATDDDPNSFWASNEPTGWVEVDLETLRQVSIVELGEPIRYGQRIAAYRIEAWDTDHWREIARGTTIGRRRLVRFSPVIAQRWRLVIENALAPTAISTFALYEGGSAKPVNSLNMMLHTRVK